MSELLTQHCKDYIKPRRKMKLDGRRWEYPIPKSTGYWEKFCDDEEKKLLVVRDPSNLSYNSFFKEHSKLLNFNTRVSNKSSNIIPPLKSRADRSIDSESSLHKWPPRSTVKSNRPRSNDKKLFPKSILKVSPQAPSKSPSSSYSPTPAKVKQIPKLDSLIPDSDLDRILPCKTGRVDSSIQNDSKAVENSSNSSLPKLALPTSSLKSKLLKTNRLESAAKEILPEVKLEFSTNDLLNAYKKASGQQEENGRRPKEDQSSLKYSTRSAYKALKRVTTNKRLNFDPETVFEPSSRSGEEGRVKPNGSADAGKPGGTAGESPRCKKSLKGSQFAGIGVRRETSKLEASSSTIPSGSRSTSGPSPRFARLEPWESPSSRVLSSIPKLSGTSRRQQDRCLACIHKSFGTEPERKISMPLTALRKIINPEKMPVASSPRVSEDSDSISLTLPDFEDEMERVLSDLPRELDERKVKFDETRAVSGDGTVMETRDRETREEAAKQSVPDSGSLSSEITRKDDKQRCNEESLFPSETSTDKFERVPSLERSKRSPLFHSGSSGEEDSLAVSIDEDQSRPRYLAACHAPTVFEPSLEPLRALRNRKPTTLQDRIAFLEGSSLKKSASTDDEDVREKRTSTGRNVLDKAETKSSAARTLTKAKSVAGGLMLDVDRAASREYILKKGSTVADFSVPRVNEEDSSREAKDTSELEGSMGEKVDIPKLVTRLPLTDPNEVIGILEGIQESAAVMLERLCKEFSERLSGNVPSDDSVAASNKKMITSLTRLLVDAKRYLDPGRFPSDLVFSSNQPPPCNPQLLKRILPEKSYNLIAPLLGLPVSHPRRETPPEQSRHIDQRRVSGATDGDRSSASLEVHPPTPGDRESLNGEGKVGHRRYNPYALFLRKPRRKVITWRPLETADLEGYDANATLEMRANNIMSGICEDFCRWLDTLGGGDKTVDEEALKDMFEIDFNTDACRSMQVLVQEAPVVPTEVALTRNTPGASKLAMTKKHVMKDAKAEHTPARTTAFGTAVPGELQFRPPKNRVHTNWLQCDHVPTDLETMDVVWNGITHLKSVRGFVEWLQQHPEVPPPDPLKTLVLMDIEALRQVEDDEGFAHLELDIYQIKSLRVIDTVRQ
ncbi:uncharacterized protein LOC116430202 [Nomia melanderi]|uniref:uncharacterized protein LOC116430202 n=1 Tax=Nomia melanderi TaxID=2448451 RepID=UPI003FCE6AFC